ncbi:prophage tail fiber N-terminal domain-containing protein [Escherichia phage JLBYU40]|uniref:Prophage tail fiber N-terminal domain-containing protein n=1 Tax=Escherichia phage JLBYU40 TaxID=2894749 RepID=A0AAE8YY22_9CAUD|nr:prophage tail fiber N-terminal domain-containing protein [Escherichia phage JLBYU40]
MAVTTKIIVQQILNIDDTKATASKFPRYTVILGNSISSITASELVSSIEAAAKSAAAAKDSEIAAKTSELNAKNSEQEAAISAGASEASATQSATSATQSAASADKSAESAAAAKVSETNAKASETKAKTSETNAKTSETNAKSSETKAKASETNAKASETNATASAAAAKLSEDNAKVSETNAAASAADSSGFRNEAETFSTQAATSASAAKTSETNAKASETNAKASETKTKASETNAASSATSASQSVTTIQGLKSDVEQLKSDTQAIKNSAVTETTAIKADVAQLKTDTQGIKNSAITETTALKNQAATSATSAANSATEAGKQATSAANSANTAKTEADRSKTEADRSEAAANSTPDIQPLPDVWIPFNDSLDMITGFAPGYKKITVGDEEITLPSDKIVSFTRASTATYINKSGALTIAEINEPRFEKEGLLIEGQRTNYFANSNAPELWNSNSGLSKSETKTDDRGFKYATFGPGVYSGSTGTYGIILGNSQNNISVVKDDAVTLSFRARGHNLRFVARFSKGETPATVAVLFIDSDTLATFTSGQDASNITVKNVVQDGEWVAIEVVYKVTDNSAYINGGIQIVQKADATYDDSSFVEVTTPQIEKGSCASSFIITSSTPATRASDMVLIPTDCNQPSSIPLSLLVEVNRNWDIAPNSAPRIVHVANAPEDQLLVAFRVPSSDTVEPLPYSQLGVSQSFTPVSTKTSGKMVTGFVCNKSSELRCVTNAVFGAPVKTTWKAGLSKNLRIGGISADGGKHLFGHVRNFRIWHKELTDRQMRESV